MQRDHLKMLVCLDVRHTASRRMIGGIMRFAATHPAWEVQLAQMHPSDRPLADFADWRPDALIADSSCHALPRATLVRLANKAAVYVNTPPPFKRTRLAVATIRPNERALATAAANLLLRRKPASFAFAGTGGDEKWCEARERLFRACLKDRGRVLHVLVPPTGTNWNQQEAALAAALGALPKPCAVWAAYDQRAKQILDACRLADLAVPRQVMILGVDDEHVICEHTSPTLSSVAPDFEAGGYLAAEFCDTAIGQGNRPNRHVTHLRFGMLGVVERLSTADTDGAMRRVSEAREFIRKNAATGIGVPEVATALRVSRRLLEKSFHDATDKTVLTTILDARFELVTKMLRETATPIDALSRFCGFRSPTHLMTLFRRRYGMTMTAYRQHPHPPRGGGVRMPSGRLPPPKAVRLLSYSHGFASLLYSSDCRFAVGRARPQPQRHTRCRLYNMYEWCLELRPNREQLPLRVVRGGSYGTGGSDCYSGGNIGGDSYSNHDGHVGFRICRSSGL